jgi:hypothetical protein
MAAICLAMAAVASGLALAPEALLFITSFAKWLVLRSLYLFGRFRFNRPELSARLDASEATATGLEQ